MLLHALVPWIFLKSGQYRKSIPYLYTQLKFLNLISYIRLNPTSMKRQHLYGLKFSLIGRFFSYRLNIDVIQSWAFDFWMDLGLRIMALMNGFFLISFHFMEDFTHVYLEEGLGFLARLFFHLESWSTRFNVTKINMLPIWVCLPKLPLGFLDECIIQDISNVVGQFITLDNVNKSRSNFFMLDFMFWLSLVLIFPKM